MVLKKEETNREKQITRKEGTKGKRPSSNLKVNGEGDKVISGKTTTAKATVNKASANKASASKIKTTRATTTKTAAQASNSKEVTAKSVPNTQKEKQNNDHSSVVRPRNNKSKVKNKKPSIFKRILHTVLILCCLFIIWCGYLVWLMNDHPAQQDLAHADAGIVLGAALWRDQPSPALRERLQMAVELFNNGKVDYLILSGGTGGLLSTISEAEGMRNFLLDKGIPEDKLLLESLSVNTFQNILFSQKVMQEHQLNSSIIITHDYHLPRAIEMANYLKYESPQGAAVHSKVLSPVYNQAREILSLTKWKLEWALLQMKILSPELIK